MKRMFFPPAVLFIPLLCLSAPKFAKPSANVPDNVKFTENIVYTRVGERKIELDLCVPKGKGPFPGILLIHGGGWKSGTKARFSALGLQLAERGYVVTSINYRLSVEARFPAAIHDCKAAVRWMRANAGKIKLDKTYIACVGGSAGGHLAALMATSGGIGAVEGTGGNPKESSTVQAAVVFAGPMNNFDKYAGKSRAEHNENALLFFGGTCDENPEIYKLGSPITHVGPNTPPILFIDSEFDHPPDRYATMRKKMDALGIRNDFLLVKGGKHGCWNRSPWQEQYVGASAEFIKSTR